MLAQYYPHHTIIREECTIKMVVRCYHQAIIRFQHLSKQYFSYLCSCVEFSYIKKACNRRDIKFTYHKEHRQHYQSLKRDRSRLWIHVVCSYSNILNGCLTCYNYWLSHLLCPLIGIITMILPTTVNSYLSVNATKILKVVDTSPTGIKSSCESGQVQSQLTTMSRIKRHRAHRSKQKVSECQTATAAQTDVSCTTSDIRKSHPTPTTWAPADNHHPHNAAAY